MAPGWHGRDELLNCCFSFADKKYSRSFVKLWLNPWCHMDYFTNLLATFLNLNRVRTLPVYGRVRELKGCIKNILISVPKMNGGLKGFGTTWRWVIAYRIFLFGPNFSGIGVVNKKHMTYCVQQLNKLGEVIEPASPCHLETEKCRISTNAQQTIKYKTCYLNYNKLEWITKLIRYTDTMYYSAQSAVHVLLSLNSPVYNLSQVKPTTSKKNA